MTTWKKCFLAISLIAALLTPLPIEASGKTPATVVAKARQIQAQRGGWMSCTDGSCFITARNGKWMITVKRKPDGTFHIWEQKK